ncbi:unnamed protein product [Gordionus sp. m RMFG-2023]
MTKWKEGTIPNYKINDLFQKKCPCQCHAIIENQPVNSICKARQNNDIALTKKYDDNKDFICNLSNSNNNNSESTHIKCGNKKLYKSSNNTNFTPNLLPLMLLPRYKHCSCYHKGYIYVFGGQPDPSSKLNDIWKLNVSTFEWTRIICNNNITASIHNVGSRRSSLNNDVPCPRSSATLLALPYNNNKLVLFGGHALSSTLFELPRMLNTLHIFDISLNTWKKIDPLAKLRQSSSRVNHSFKNADKHDNESIFLSDIYANPNNKMLCYEEDCHESGEFSDLKASYLYPPATAGHTAALFELSHEQANDIDGRNDKSSKSLFMLVFGGLCSPGPYSSNALWVFDLQNLSWSPAPLNSTPTQPPSSYSNLNFNQAEGDSPPSRFNHSHAPIKDTGDWFIIGGISTTGFKFLDSWLLRTHGSFYRDLDTTEIGLRRPWYWVQIKIRNIFSNPSSLHMFPNRVPVAERSFSVDRNIESNVTENDTSSTPLFNERQSSMIENRSWPANLWARSSAYVPSRSLLLMLAHDTRRREEKESVPILVQPTPDHNTLLSTNIVTNSLYPFRLLPRTYLNLPPSTSLNTEFLEKIEDKELEIGKVNENFACSSNSQVAEEKESIREGDDEYFYDLLTPSRLECKPKAGKLIINENGPLSSANHASKIRRIERMKAHFHDSFVCNECRCEELKKKLTANIKIPMSSPKTLDLYYLDLAPLNKILKLTSISILKTEDLPVLNWCLSGYRNKITKNNAPETIFYSLDCYEDCMIIMVGGARISIPSMASHVPEITSDKVTNDAVFIY